MCPVSYVCDRTSALNPRSVTSGGGRRSSSLGRWWRRGIRGREEQHPWRKTSAAAESVQKKSREVFNFGRPKVQ